MFLFIYLFIDSKMERAVTHLDIMHNLEHELLSLDRRLLFAFLEEGDAMAYSRLSSGSYFFFISSSFGDILS